MEGLCGAHCDECELFNNTCKGCKGTDGCPFGKKCWIAKYIELDGIEGFNKIKDQLIKEINSLDIDGMSKIEELYPLHGSFVNLEYPISSDIKVKLLGDNDIYLGNQVECLFNDEDIKRCYGIVANMNFIIICEYGENGSNPELLLYKKR